MKKIKITLAVLTGVAAVTLVTVGSVFAANATAEKNSIGSDAAAQIALADAGFTKDDAQNIRSVFEREDGRYVFDVEFFVNGVEYDYLIDANLGSVIERDTDAENNDRNNAPQNNEQVQITLEEAKAIALRDAGLNEADVTFNKARLDDDKDDYDIEFYTEDKEYDYEISAVSGKITESEVENRRNNQTSPAASEENPANNQNSTPNVTVSTPEAQNNSNQEYIGNERAKEIAFEHAGVKADEVYLSKIKIDRDDGRHEYEIEFYKGDIEYEYDIDAYTGKILDFERDHKDD